MKAKYDDAILFAQGIIRQQAASAGISYEQAYMDLEEVIQACLASTDPETVEFWDLVKNSTKREQPIPEDMILYGSANYRVKLFKHLAGLMPS